MSKKHKPSQTVSSRKIKPSLKDRQQKRNRQWISLGFAILAVLAVILLAKPKSAQVIEISAAQAYQKYQQGMFILDVRTQEEWDLAHIENSSLVPLAELKNNLSELPRDREIVVVCRSGNRSREAVSILEEAGFSDVFSLKGGMIAWENAGYPLEKSSP